MVNISRMFSVNFALFRVNENVIVATATDLNEEKVVLVNMHITIEQHKIEQH